MVARHIARLSARSPDLCGYDTCGASASCHNQAHPPACPPSSTLDLPVAGMLLCPVEATRGHCVAAAARRDAGHSHGFHEAAVDDIVRPGDEGRAVRDEERDEVGDL